MGKDSYGVYNERDKIVNNYSPLFFADLTYIKISVFPVAPGTKQVDNSTTTQFIHAQVRVCRFASR